MRIPLWRPSASSQRVFQKTPGRRSTQGTALAFTKRLGGGVVTRAISFSAGRRGARVAQGPADRVAELLDGQRALDLLSVHEEGRRGTHARGAALALVGGHRVPEPGRVEAVGEARDVEAEAARVAQQLLAREGRLAQEEPVLVLQESPLGPRAARGEGRGQRALVRAEWEVLEHEPDRVGELAQEAGHGVLGLLAERALEVAPIEDGHPRGGGPPGHGGLDG